MASNSYGLDIIVAIWYLSIYRNDPSCEEKGQLDLDAATKEGLNC